MNRDLLDFYTNAPLLELGAEADRVRIQRHPHNTVTYIVDRNINYTNVCVADCGFCAFYRRPKHNEGWTLSYEQIGAKIDEAKDATVVQVMDKAIEPDRKSKPRRTLIVLLSAFLALFVSILWAFFREAAARAKGDPETSSRLVRLRDYMGWKKR